MGIRYSQSSSGSSLAQDFPEIAAEADGWDPAQFLAKSNKKLPWKCSKGHKWITQVNTRTRGSNCPFCSGFKCLSGFNDLGTTHPEIAKEANGWDPAKIVGGFGKKLSWQCSKGHVFEAKISDRKNGDGCPYCSNRKLLKGFNDLATTHPEIAKDANGWDPAEIVAGSNKKLSWKCSKGHVWDNQPNARRAGRGCPYCSNQKVWIGFNDLATTHPELANKAYDWNPTEIVAGNNTLRKWNCSQGHIFVARSTDLVQGKSCGVCANKQLLKGFNDLATHFPEIAAEADGWDPSEVLFGSNKVFSWKCSIGHKWKANLSNRSGRGDICPNCAEHGFSPEKDAWLYFLKHSYWGMQQIGITNSPKSRIKKHEKLGWEVCEIRGPMEGFLARAWEKSILMSLKARKIPVGSEGPWGKFDGFTECWNAHDFEATSIQELMEIAEEH